MPDTICKGCNYEKTYKEPWHWHTCGKTCGGCKHCPPPEEFVHPYPDHACAFNDGKSICECYGEGLRQRETVPMGVSQWMQYGTKYGYDAYFAEQTFKDVRTMIESLQQDPEDIRHQVFSSGKHDWEGATRSGAFAFSYNTALDDLLKMLPF